MMTDYLEILNLVKADQWDEAHLKVQECSGRLACLIHGYLHRIEGDLSNARYWYNRAHEDLPKNSLAEEWERIYSMIKPSSYG